jgi:hypothetical protein
VRGKWFEVNDLNHSATDAPTDYKSRIKDLNDINRVDVSRVRYVQSG